jgi:hypothetical protein
MVAEQRRISFDEFARTLDAVFDEVAERQEPILVQRGGRLYRLAPAAADRTDDIWANYDPQEVWQAWEAAREARIFEGVDVEQLKADIKAARGQDSIGRPGD